MENDEFIIDVEIFGQVPIQIMRQKWLTFNTLRVYIALISFQGGGKTCFPSREEIGERAGISESKVSNAIKILRDKKWVRVKRRMNSSNIYSCLSRATSANFVSITDETSFVPEKGTSFVPETVTSFVPDSGSLKDHVKRPSKKNNNTSPDVQTLNQHYLDAVKKACGEYPANAGRSGKVFKELLLLHPQATIMAKLNAWMKDKWVIDKGFPIGAFLNSFHKIKAEPPKKPGTIIPEML